MILDPLATTLPTDWTCRPMKRLLSEPLKYGANESGGFSDPECPRYIRITDFGSDGKLRDYTFSSLPSDVAANFLLNTEDLLFARSGATVGKCYYYGGDDGAACFAGYLIKASPKPSKLDSRFLYHFTNSPQYSSWRDSTFVQATIENIGAQRYGYLPVPLPPLPEQKRIAAYLDASCVVIDRAVEAKQKQLETLDALRKSIITQVVLSGLNQTTPTQDTGNTWLEKIPIGWKLVALKRVSETQTGITLGKTYEPPLVERPYLRAANVQDGYLDLEKITTIEIPETLASRYELQSGDVLMTEGGDLDKLGRGFPWEGQIAGCLHQNHVFAIRTNSRLLLSKFLAYVTASRYGRDYFEATGKRTTNLASTNSTKVGLFPIPLPPLEEQRMIVNHLDDKLEQTKLVETSILAQITTLTAYRKSLIHECVTGKRRISDADVSAVQHGRLDAQAQ